MTVTLWGAELAPLSQKGKRAQAAIASFASRFSSILRQLRAGAPAAEIIVTGAWNPEADRLDENRAALPLGRRGDRTSRGGVARACREHVRGAERARERQGAAGSALQAHLLLLEGRSASDRRRLPCDGGRVHGRFRVLAMNCPEALTSAGRAGRRGTRPSHEWHWDGHRSSPPRRTGSRHGSRLRR